MMVPTTDQCRVEDIRFEAVFYAHARVNESGEPDHDELAGEFAHASTDWHTPDECYWCVACDEGFKSWGGVQLHLGEKQ